MVILRAGAAPELTPIPLILQREPNFQVVLCPLVECWHKHLTRINPPTKHPSNVGLSPNASTFCVTSPVITPVDPEVYVARHLLGGNTVIIENLQLLSLL